MLKRNGTVFALAMTLAAVCALAGLFPRFQAERSNSSAALVTDIRDVAAMAREEGVTLSDALETLEGSGLTALALGELTGQDLVDGALPLVYGPVGSLTGGALPEGVVSEQAAVFVADEDPMKDRVLLFLAARFPGLLETPWNGGTLLVLPVVLDETLEAGILPDYAYLEAVARSGMPVIYRPGSTPGVGGEQAAGSVAMVLDRYPCIRCVVPSGLVVTGYPETGPLIEVLRERKIPVAKVEFSQQIGIGVIDRALFPAVLSLHSVKKEEIVKRRLTRDDLVERFVRAGRERSVRILYVRPSDLLSGSRLGAFAEECRRISGRLEKLGVSMEWPGTYGSRSSAPISALALALAFTALLLKVSGRFVHAPCSERRIMFLAAAGVLLLAAALLKIGLAARLAGALTAVFAATEGTLAALEGYKKPFRGILHGVGIIIAAGLAIAAFYGNTWYMLRMGTFSGVKATLLLPPLLVLLYDLKTREHPESLKEVLTRPPLWGEMLLAGLLLGAAALVVFRSGNVSFVPGWEIRFREMLEQLLTARPRTKELFVGYPALILWYYVRRADIWPHYREIFRLGVTMAFCSAINSFCHFHTHIMFIILRVFNGLWTGLLLGLFLAACLRWIVLPAWKRWGGLVVD